MVQEAGPCRLDRAARAGSERSCAGAGAIRPAPAGHRGCRQAHQHPEDRAIRRRAVHRRAYGADRRRADRLRRNPLFVGRGYVVSVRHGASTSYAAGARAVRVVPDRAVARRGLHPLRHPRFHRRQLHAGGGDGRRAKSTRSRTGCSHEPISARRSATALHAAARIAASCATRRCRWSTSAAGSSMPK